MFLTKVTSDREKHSRLVLAVVLALIYPASSTFASPASPTGFKLASSTNDPSPSIGKRSPPPIGWVQFCRDYARDPRNPCKVEPLPAVDVVLSQFAMKELVRVNQSVNASIEPVTDIDHWGVPDKWDYPDDGKGDCEDYVIEKRHRLMQAGFPRQSLLITVVRDKQGEGHAILTVKTDKGDYVLDNQVDEILPWDQTGYKFIKRQDQQDPNIWISLGPAEQRMTAAR